MPSRPIVGLQRLAEALRAEEENKHCIGLTGYLVHGDHEPLLGDKPIQMGKALELAWSSGQSQAARDLAGHYVAMQTLWQRRPDIFSPGATTALYGDSSDPSDPLQDYRYIDELLFTTRWANRGYKRVTLNQAL